MIISGSFGGSFIIVSFLNRPYSWRILVLYLLNPSFKGAYEGEVTLLSTLNFEQLLCD